MKYRKKLVVVEATQWFGEYDGIVRPVPTQHLWRGEPDCRCGFLDDMHGYIETLEGGHIEGGHIEGGHIEGGHIVCLGDWIITDVKGEHYPCKPDIFEATYEAVEEPEHRGPMSDHSDESEWI